MANQEAEADQHARIRRQRRELNETQRVLARTYEDLHDHQNTVEHKVQALELRLADAVAEASDAEEQLQLSENTIGKFRETIAALAAKIDGLDRTVSAVASIPGSCHDATEHAIDRGAESGSDGLR